MSKEKIISLLEEGNVDKPTIMEFMSLLKSCEFARYTPSSSDTMREEYEKAVITISALDKQL